MMTQSVEKWEKKLHEARELRKRGAAVLYQRVALLVVVYEDAEFRRYHADAGTNELDFLDEELSDTAANFLTLKAVYDSHPQEADWVKHNVRDLIALAMQKPGTPKDNVAPRVSWKDRAEAAERECERLRAELASIKESLGIVASARCA
jgi:hypothetical protein